MAFIFKNGSILVNSVDLSTHCNSIEVSYSAELQDITVFSDSARARLPGLKDGSITATYFQDFTSGTVDATHFTLLGNTGFTVTVRPTTTARGASNPDYSATFVLGEGMALTGSIGDAPTVSYTYTAITELTRTVSST